MPGAGEDTRGCAIARTSCLGSHAEVLQRQPEGVTPQPAPLAGKAASQGAMVDRQAQEPVAQPSSSSLQGFQAG